MEKRAVLLILILLTIASLSIPTLEQKQRAADKELKDNLENTESTALSAINSTTINISETQNLTNQTLEIPKILEIDYECLNDSHCNDTGICVNHTCKELNCEFPYYGENHKCEKVECINSNECKENQFCWNVTHVCVKPACDYCEYAGNHTCMKYACCADKECPEKKSVCFYHKCLVNPAEIPFDIALTGNRRTSYRTILDYSVLKNFDVGLLLIQDQTKMDYINNKVLYLWDNATFNFTDYVLLVVMHHGIIPADIRITKILRLDDNVYVDIVTDEGKTGFTDDAWEAVAIRKENFTYLPDLKFIMTPTGKMVIGGEIMLSGITITPPPSPPLPPLPQCVNDTKINEGETEIIDLSGKYYEISVKSTDYYKYVSFTFDYDGTTYNVGEGNSTKIRDIRIYANRVYYDAREWVRGYAIFTLCSEK